MNHYLIVGAGFSGAVLARKLAEAGHRVDLIEQRAHLGGNCHSARDAKTQIMVHIYGPHIFHTDDENVWQFVQRFGQWHAFTHRVKTTVGGKVYTLPINLHTINQFFQKALRPEEAQAFITQKAERNITEPRSFEEQALYFVGRELYDAFFKGYTEKQWGCSPRALPASILKRLPLRFHYDDNYFAHRFQAMPESGYTAVIANMLDHASIQVQCNTAFEHAMKEQYDHVFYTGTLDGYFDYALGRLAYRTLDFERFEAAGDYQGCAVMNYGDRDIPFTRITEHKHFAPWETHDQTICYREYSRDCGENDTPYYPIRLLAEQKMLQRYVARAQQETKISFLGRLGTYRYLDMDVTIREALDAAEIALRLAAEQQPIPVFFRAM